MAVDGTGQIGRSVASDFPSLLSCTILIGVTGALAVAGIVATGIGIGIGIEGVSPLVRAIPPDLEGIGPRLTGTAVSFIFAVGEIGGFRGPVLIGSLRDATSAFRPGLAILASGALVVALAGTALRALDS